MINELNETTQHIINFLVIYPKEYSGRMCFVLIGNCDTHIYSTQRFECLTSYAKLLELKFIFFLSFLFSSSYVTVHAIASQPEYCVLFNAYDILCNKIEGAREQKSFGMELIDKWKDAVLMYHSIKTGNACARLYISCAPIFQTSDYLLFIKSRSITAAFKNPLN